MSRHVCVKNAGSVQGETKRERGKLKRKEEEKRTFLPVSASNVVLLPLPYRFVIIISALSASAIASSPAKISSPGRMPLLPASVALGTINRVAWKRGRGVSTVVG